MLRVSASVYGCSFNHPTTENEIQKGAVYWCPMETSFRSIEKMQNENGKKQTCGGS